MTGRPRPMAPSRIVFITGDEDARERVESLLSGRGFRVAFGGDGSLDPDLTSEPHLVIVDTALVRADAATLVGRLAAAEAPRSPILVLGERERPEAAVAAARAGADDVVFRPLDALGLPARVEGLVARATLAEARESARTLEFRNQELESFIYIVTHDMKTPVVNLQGLVGLIEQDHAEDLPDEVRDYLTRLRRNAERLEELLRDLLEYPRRLQIVTQVEDCSMGEVVAEAVDGLRELAEAAGVKVSVAEDLPRISGDPRRLQQVIHNLVENAIKHSREHGDPRVEVGWSRTPRGPLFHVRDNGPGIPREHLQDVFRLFHRIPGTPSEGTGIGLAVARQLIEAHGGEIWCESPEGEGTTFLFCLPT